MDGARDLDRERRQDPRAELHVDLVYDSFSSFLSAAAGNLSRGGMFLAVPKSVPAGTRLSFEARLRDGSSLIRGEGEVVWARAEVTAGLPVGVAIRFSRLSAQGRDLITRLLEQHPDDKGGAVRLGGVRLGKAKGASETTPVAVERSLPLGESPDSLPVVPRETHPLSRATVREWTGHPRQASTSGEPVRSEPTRAADIRVTDEVGSEFDFTLPPWETEQVPPELRPPNPVRNVLIAVAVLCAALVALYLGPLNLVGMVVHLGSAVVHRLLPGPSPTLTPTAVHALPSSEPAPTPVLGPSPSPAGADAIGADRYRDGATQTPLIIDRVAWRRDAGGVVVTVEADREIPQDAVHSSWLSEPPRHIVRILGVGGYRGSAAMDVGRRDLVRVRVGLHHDRALAELHIVLDLASSAVKVEPLVVHGRRMEIAVRSGAP